MSVSRENVLPLPLMSSKPLLTMSERSRDRTSTLSRTVMFPPAGVTGASALRLAASPGAPALGLPPPPAPSCHSELEGGMPPAAAPWARCCRLLRLLTKARAAGQNAPSAAVDPAEVPLSDEEGDVVDVEPPTAPPPARQLASVHVLMTVDTDV